MSNFVTAMKNINHIILLIFVLIFSALQGLAQQTELELQQKNKVSTAEKSEKVITESVPLVISAELIKRSNDTLTFKITHPDLKQTLYSSSEKRDALTALPGIIEIALFGDEPSFTVKMLGFYAEKYLKTQFDICREENPELFEMMKK